MGTLYIDRRDLSLDVDAAQLRVREPGDGGIRGYPLAGIERVVIAGNAQLSARLLTRLAEQGTSVLLLEGRGARRHAHVGAFAHGDGLRRLGQYRLCSGADTVLHWSRRLVRLRGLLLLRLYRRALQLRPDCRHPLLRVQRALAERLGALGSAESLSTLRGMEGAMAGAHFEAFACLLSPELGFEGRNRRPPRDPVNAALSLGYTLTHSDAVRACLIAGLDPMLGTLHEPAYGRESLACDLNELARADVEHLVWRLFADKRLRKDSFEFHAGGVSLNKTGRQLYFAAYEGGAEPHRRRLRAAAAALARHCNLLGAGTP